jgi:endonuclease YncB( thermonuclease family)
MTPFSVAQNADAILAQVSDASTVPWLTLEGIRTAACVVSVTDGDTVVLVLPLAIADGGSHTLCKVRARLKGIDACELRAKDPRLRAKAEQARDALKASSQGLVDVACHEFDRYGRLLVDLFARPSGESVATALVASGLAFECHDGVRMSEQEQLRYLQSPSFL